MSTAHEIDDPHATASDGRYAPDDLMTSWSIVLESFAAVESTLMSALCDDGLTLTEFEVLARLGREQHHRLSMSHLACELAMSSGGLTKLIDRMEGNGLVRRQHNPTDRRVVFAGLTPLGIERAHAGGPQELVRLRSALERIAGSDAMLRVAEAAWALHATSGASAA